jgi:hypothetical protein
MCGVCGVCVWCMCGSEHVYVRCVVCVVCMLGVGMRKDEASFGTGPCFQADPNPGW